MWSKTMKKACLELIFSRTANLELAILLKMSYSQANFIGFNKKFCITYFFRTLFSGWSWWCIQDVSYLHVFCMFFYMLFSHVCAFYVFCRFISILRIRCEEMLSICKTYSPVLTWTFGEPFLQSYKFSHFKCLRI